MHGAYLQEVAPITIFSSSYQDNDSVMKKKTISGSFVNDIYVLSVIRSNKTAIKVHTFIVLAQVSSPPTPPSPKKNK